MVAAGRRIVSVVSLILAAANHVTYRVRGESSASVTVHKTQFGGTPVTMASARAS